MCAYIPVQESSIPELVTSDDGTCGNDTIVHVFEHILYNPARALRLAYMVKFSPR